jgi:hypothetical protein
MKAGEFSLTKTMSYQFARTIGAIGGAALLRRRV